MISFVKGLLVQTNPLKVTIDVRGIGYLVFIPTHLLNQLPALNEEILLHTSFVIREFSQALYGFLSPLERDLFEVLMDVSGVGPKLALSIVSHLSLGELQQAVSNRQITTLCKVPGIGKKTAERLTIELQDKLAALIPHHAADFAIPIPMSTRDQQINDAMRALINLGYTQLAAQKAIKESLKNAPDESDVAALITSSLKHI
jgi:holliday junction DNA helicase RuvA